MSASLGRTVTLAIIRFAFDSPEYSPAGFMALSDPAAEEARYRFRKVYMSRYTERSLVAVNGTVGAVTHADGRSVRRKYRSYVNR